MQCNAMYVCMYVTMHMYVHNIQYMIFQNLDI